MAWLQNSMQVSANPLFLSFAKWVQNAVHEMHSLDKMSKFYLLLMTSSCFVLVLEPLAPVLQYVEWHVVGLNN